jgi:hypothetical protein
MISGRRGIRVGTLVGLLTSWLVAAPAFSGIHTWDVREVFSNADGTIQYVELYEANGTAGETGVGNGTISSTTQSFTWSNGAVVGPTSNRSYLIATQSFADLPGAPTPDAIIPLSKIPFFNVAGDTVAFGGFDSWVFGAVPTNGTDSLDRASGVGLNTPKNYANVTGSVDANPSNPPVPVASAPAIGLLLTLLATVGFAVLWSRRTRTA